MGRRPNPSLPLTPRQEEVLCFMWDFYGSNDMLPPVQYIAAGIGDVFPNAVQGMLLALQRKGFIEKNACGKWKFTAKTRAGMVECPVSGTAYAPNFWEPDPIPLGTSGPQVEPAVTRPAPTRIAT